VGPGLVWVWVLLAMLLLARLLSSRLEAGGEEWSQTPCEPCGLVSGAVWCFLDWCDPVGGKCAPILALPAPHLNLAHFCKGSKSGHSSNLSTTPPLLTPQLCGDAPVWLHTPSQTSYLVLCAPKRIGFAILMRTGLVSGWIKALSANAHWQGDEGGLLQVAA